MGFKVGLEYYDGNTSLERPTEVTLDALPPLSASVQVKQAPYIVNGIHIDVNNDGSSQYILELKGISAN